MDSDNEKLILRKCALEPRDTSQHKSKRVKKTSSSTDETQHWMQSDAASVNETNLTHSEDNSEPESNKNNGAENKVCTVLLRC